MKSLPHLPVFENNTVFRPVFENNTVFRPVFEKNTVFRPVFEIILDDVEKYWTMWKN